MAASARSEFLLILAALGGVLLLASVVSRVLQARDGGGQRALVLANLEARIRSWWVMVALMAGAVLLGPQAVVALFGVVAVAAYRELAAHAVPALRDRALDAAGLVLVVLQFVLVALGVRSLVPVALPVAATLGLPLVALVSGAAGPLQARVAHRLWWVMLTGWCLSHVPALLLLPIPAFEGRNLLLVVFLVIVVQASDVLQYVFGKLYGRRPVAPALSPGKTVEGLVGGVAAASAIGTALWWMTPFEPAQAFAASLMVTTLGFLGGLVLSGMKRDLGIKDWGQAIRGHGGVLDRVDSLCLSAPALFYVLLAFWT